MKNIHCRLVVASLLFVSSHSLFAQGSFTPSGAPAPLFKKIQQVEPRTPISSLPFTITNAGSYYLTTNLASAIARHGQSDYSKQRPGQYEQLRHLGWKQLRPNYFKPGREFYQRQPLGQF